MSFKLRQLQGFVAAARYGSFSNAARELAMTQPAFSQMVRELEATLNLKLFERTTRRVELTDAGRRLRAMVERPLDDLDAAYRYARDLAAGRRGRIVFASLPSVAFEFATLVLARYKGEYPGIAVRLIEDQNEHIVQRVLDREVDFGIGTLEGERPELAFRELLHDELLAVVPVRHHLARASLTWRDVASEPLALLPRQSSVRELADAGLAANGVPREPAYEVANMVTALGIVRAGLGITVLPAIALMELNMRGLHASRIRNPRPSRRIGIITRVDRTLSPPAAAYVEMLFSDPRRAVYNAPALRARPAGRRKRRTPAPMP